MELKSLNCPRCGAVVETEDGLDTFFCKYCGNKIVLSGQSDAAYQAKSKLLEYQNDEKKWVRDETSKDNDLNRKYKDDLRRMIALVVIVVIVLIVFRAILKTSI